MAYYTIAHLIHGSIDNLSGPTSVSGVLPEDFNDEVFDYIFLNKPYPSCSNIPEKILNQMRSEFEYWYSI
jgi:leucyl-tRNA synthetase